MATIHQVELLLSIQHLELPNVAGVKGGPFTNMLGPRRGIRKKYPFGATAGKVDLAWFRRTPTAIAASGNQDFDLAGSLTDRYGTTITMAKVLGVVLLNFNTAGTLTLRCAGTNGLTTLFTGASDGMIAGAALDADNPGWVAASAPGGLTVTAGTGDKINVLNNDGTNAADYLLGLWGRTA